MGKPKKINCDAIDPQLAIAFRAVGLPRTMWPGTVAKMSDAVVAGLIASIKDDAATPATQAAYKAWQKDRKTKVAAAPTPSTADLKKQTTALIVETLRATDGAKPTEEPTK